MSESVKIAAEVQKLGGDSLIELFILDLTALGGELFYFHNKKVNGAGTLGFNSMTFASIPFEAKGFAVNGTEQNPMPTMSIGAVDGLIRALTNEFDDFTGAKLTRIRTFRKHLDDGSDPDGTAAFSNDIFAVERKASENKLMFEFALGSSFDVYGQVLPGRKCLARCQWQYKDGVNCPYSGVLTTCDHTPEDCETHCGAGEELPFGGFPGLERYREIA